jgi:succinyl-diaminopimelate desuccinylase
LADYSRGYRWLEAHSGDLLNFLQKLVQTPSQNGIDTERAMVELIVAELGGFGFKPQLFGNPERPSLLCDYAPRQENARTLWLEAPLDTVVSGDPANWSHAPFAAEIHDGRLFGRGAADCKAGIAITVYVTAALKAEGYKLKGNLLLGYDADEQGGAFTGIKTLLENCGKVDACIIGYPGNDEIAVAARGFLRLKISTSGQSAHTGMRTGESYENAISLMAEIVNALEKLHMRHKKSKLFWFGPRLTVAQISGGAAINVVPEKCEIGVDIRLVPGQTKESVLEEIDQWLRKKLGEVVFSRRVKIEPYQYEPPYVTADSRPIVKTLRTAAKELLDKKIPLVASGPSNIGNVIGNRDIDTINGFGASGANVHAADEYVMVDSLVPVAKVYLKTVIDYLGTGKK